MNALIIILSTITCAVLAIPFVIVFRNNRKLKALVTMKEQQQKKTEQASLQAKHAEDTYYPYYQIMDALQDKKSQSEELDRTVRSLQARINLVVSEKEFLAMNTQIQALQEQVAESKKKEMALFQKAKPIMDRIEAERRRQEEIERKARQKREAEELAARRKREAEEEEERRERRRRDDALAAAAAASSYSSSSSSSSYDSGSSWSGGGGDSSGGGSSDSW